MSRPALFLILTLILKLILILGQILVLMLIQLFRHPSAVPFFGVINYHCSTPLKLVITLSQRKVNEMVEDEECGGEDRKIFGVIPIDLGTWV